MTSRIGRDGPLGKTNEAGPSDSAAAGGYDTSRYRKLRLWYESGSWSVKADFLGNLLDVHGDPLFSFALRSIFGRACTEDVVGENHSAFEVLQTDGDNRSLNRGALKRTMAKNVDWFGGLSKNDRLTTFVELTLMGGTNVVNTVRERVNRSIADDGGKPSSLRDLIADYDHTTVCAVIKKEQRNANSISTLLDDVISETDDGLLAFERILLKSNSDPAKIKDKITDSVVRRDYEQSADEWKTKLKSFDQKYQVNRSRTSSADFDDMEAVQLLPVTAVLLDKKLLDNNGEVNDTNCDDPTSVTKNAEHIPLHLSRTLASVAEYKKARNHIDLEIDRHLKIVPQEFCEDALNNKPFPRAPLT